MERVQPQAPPDEHGNGDPFGFLEGSWRVRCSNNHDDQVGGITQNHTCETCGVQSVTAGSANVVCPDNHATHVEDITMSHLCTYPLSTGGICGKQCRL